MIAAILTMEKNSGDKIQGLIKCLKALKKETGNFSFSSEINYEKIVKTVEEQMKKPSPELPVLGEVTNQI